VRGERAVFKILWHRARTFELILDVPRKTLRFPLVLPEIPASSMMYREFKQFVESRQSEELLEHRRIDISKASVKSGNKGGAVSLTLTVRDGDFDYGLRRLINLVHEVFLVFLVDGNYYQYMVDQFDLDPDKM
jgi:hypothetical protein